MASRSSRRPTKRLKRARAKTILRIFLETGAAIIAEDLGTVPDFLRPSLARLGVAGCKVLRWERHWLEPGQPFVDPGRLSAAFVRADRHA